MSRSDLAIWTEHLGEESLERFVVLNKTDILADPLSTPTALAARATERSIRSGSPELSRLSRASAWASGSVWLAGSVLSVEPPPPAPCGLPDGRDGSADSESVAGSSPCEESCALSWACD